MNRRLVVAVVVVMALGLVVIGGCASKTTTTTTKTETSPKATTTTPSGTSTSTVKIVNFTFDPGTITVKPGTEVTWTNEDSVVHTVVGTGWGSGDIAPGQTYKYTFNTAGTFDYHCKIHPYMTGKVVVSSSGTSSGGSSSGTGGTATPTTPSTPGY